MSSIDLAALDPRSRYKLLCAVVIPRPIAWVTTESKSGIVNAAPYSFFNVFGQDPALIVLGLENREGGEPKDTTRNIRDTGEFVVNILTPDLAAPMVETAAPYPADIGEPDTLGLSLAASARVAPPRLAAAPVALECRKMVSLSFSAERELLVGEALHLHARDGLIDEDTLRVEWGDDLPLARLFADRYARLVETDRHTIPDPRTKAGSDAV
ncbi:flavin reductase family protein [Paracoccus sp. TK19116]|uniref:Flavin reductase family protein n=1 Tax=Paracoccus albicereus TaxID=2922394 RepID=A0ABT1MQB2_9RHOB|nr:flavin reductase family protein [Paracoccus albicereus]MCQ0969889.1 flavin reductase family protein [Paracoccus albicereus]